MRRVGLNVTRAHNALAAKRALILSKGSISLVLDVGANVGDYGRAIRKAGYRGEILSFEPTAGSFAVLQRRSESDDAWRVANFAIGDIDSTAVIHLASSSECSSFLGVTSTSISAAQGSTQIGTEVVTVRRLDSVVTPDVNHTIYLKLDIQGFELVALRGAAGVLDRVVAIECEVSFTHLYEGQALAGEVLTELGRLGYDAIWFERGFTDVTAGYMLQADVLFLRRDLRAHVAGVT